MTALLPARRGAATLPDRLAALREVVGLGKGRLDPEALDEAQALLDRAGERLALSAQHTVVALAGATGSGKSSLFNALTGLELSQVGVRRPTTSSAHAAVWEPGPDATSGPLLDWLGVPARHAVAAGEQQRDGQRDGHRDGPSGGHRAGGGLGGLVLLDLPDHDSTELAHRLEVDRLVQLVDLLVWVVDPQKYADAALHERYLRPLASHEAVTLVVLNQVDRLDARAADSCVADLHRLLRADGMTAPQVLPVSARTGQGVGELRGLLADAVRRREALTDRLGADVDRVGQRLAGQLGGEGGSVGRRERDALGQALAGAAGVPAVVDAVARSYRSQAVLATGWPFTRWVRRLRPDPLRRLHLGPAAIATGSAGVAAGGDTPTGRTSLPAPSSVARSQVDTAVRQVVDGAAAGLPRWEVDAVRRAARSGGEGDLADALDRAVGGVDLGVARRPLWWSAVGGLQWLLAGVALVGVLWLAGLFGLSWARIPEPPTPEYRGWPWPTLLALGGALAGVLLALLSRVLARLGAARRRRRADARLRRAVTDVGQSHVLNPVQEELAAYRELRERMASVVR